MLDFVKKDITYKTVSESRDELDREKNDAVNDALKKVAQEMLANEEVGMLGALKMDIEFMYGSVNINTRMQWDKASFINVDEETYDKLYYGCAGGVNSNPSLKYETNNNFNSENYKIYKISVSGLIGGHLGVEIHKRHANAHRFMGRVMEYIQTKGKDGKEGIDFELFEINGGAADNAIEKESFAIVAVHNSDEEKFKNKINKIEVILKK